MSSKLTVLLSGVVGVDPRILFLTTSATESEVLQPGFINPIEDTSGIQINPGDFILALFQNSTKREIFVPVFGSNRLITLNGIAGDLNAPGGVTGGLNLGTGAGAYAGVSGNNLTFKSFKAGSNILLTPSGTEILISALETGITDGTNLGTGAPVFAGVDGSDLEFKTLKAGENITLTSSGTEILIDSSGGGGGITDGQNVGGGEGVFKEASGSDLVFKSIVAGSGISITASADELTIDATGAVEYTPVFFNDTGYYASGSSGYPIISGTLVAPWSANEPVDVDTYALYQFIAPSTPSNTFAVTREYANMEAGVYKLTFQMTMSDSRPIVTVREVNTNTTIGTFDTYYPGSDVLTSGQIEMYIDWQTAGDMLIEFSCPTKNPASSGFLFALFTNVSLGRLPAAVSGGSPSSNFQYEDTWFMGINGNDANDGKSINTPKATLQGCQAAFTSTRNVINVIDVGPYQDVEFLHESGDLVISAPGAKFETTGSGLPLFWVQGGNLHLKLHEIQNSFY